MLVLSMNSKRQRRPNVRLGEIGDASAAFACGVSRKDEENLVQKRWEHDFLNPKELGNNPICGFSQQKSSEFSDLDVSLRTLADVQHNRERTKPKSLKLVSEFPSSDEIDLSRSELNFGRITKKCRLRRKRSTRSTSCVFGGTWNLKISPEMNSEDGKECARKESVGFTSNACFGLPHIDGFKDYSDYESSATRNFENGIYELTFGGQRQGTSIQLTEEGAYSEGNNAFPQSFGEFEKITTPIPSQPDVNTVRRWLEDLGFGKYAGVFEMHEVDEEALPLLTLEDLKEMGVLAVGPRRKLYTAIQQLKRAKERVYA
ncbi:uncharacterized protein LOC132285385 [Cornus florida]|uniref:uncharacterized protein LOC132285385 n=1 Tax=Cornus florida TaxID=4283 RepID=UPI00289C5C4F|nr:uncharacterized protein LOC132285385 [Cornus florida]